MELNKREVFGRAQIVKDNKLLVYIPEDQMHLALPSSWISKAPINSVIRIYHYNDKYHKAELYNAYSTVDGIIVEDRIENYLVNVQASYNSSVCIIVPKNLFTIDKVKPLVGSQVTLYKSENGKIWNVIVKEEKNAEPEIQKIEGGDEEYPETVGKSRINIYYLKSEFAFNSKIIECIEKLGTEYAAFRRSRGDGNCYYRAVGVSYIEHLCRPTTNLSQFEKFISKLEKRQGIFREINGFSRRKEFLKLLDYLYSCKKANVWSAIKEAQNIFQDINDDETIVREMRAIASLYLVDNSTSTKLSGFLISDEIGYGTTQSVYMKMMKMGEEAEGVAFNCMSEALQIRIHHICLRRDGLDIHTFEPEESNNSDMYLLLKPGHYDLLYTHKQIQDDCYDLETCQFLPQGSQNRSDQQAVRGAPEDYTAKLLNHVQYLYENLYHLSVSNKLHRSDLLPDFGQRISSFWNEFTSLDNCNYSPSLSDLTKAEENLLKLAKSDNFACRLLEICFYCQEKQACIMLKCGHLYCQEDIIDCLEQQTAGMFLLNPFEKTSPITCLMCTQEISQDEVKAVLGNTWQDYDKMREERQKQYQHKIDRGQGIIICPNCEGRKKQEDFRNKHKCMCDSCISNIVSQTKICPICEEEIRMEEIVGIVKPVCGYCQEVITEFSLVKCKTHWLCINCESFSYLPQNCIFCHRNFSKGEYELISTHHKFYCDICKGSFNQEDLNPSLCPCTICKGCFNSCVNDNGSVCYFCGRMIEEIDISVLKKFEDPAPLPSKKSCAVCIEEFSRAEMLTLSCDHYFCKNCLVGYLESEIDSGRIINGIKCPIPECLEIVDGSIMIANLSPEKWDHYNKISIKKQYKITECPKCNSEFEIDQNKVRCPQCKAKFCAACLKDQHEGSCDENERKELLRDLEKEGESVSECPGCHYPYLKDNACDHVKCTQPDCGIEFCFRCSCIRAPTLVHGNHYHRPECNFHAEYNGEDVYSPDKCIECKKLGRLCPKPQKLKAQRKFDEGEV
ncbi:unnamed protein product [Blepharisma stoltei]|uniref:Ubiquitinyl hydrolase 1 n=1 Tax=Blepharisma stoltei TaxID=1481888 RepID=A0AAU9IB04_9CILI|nr:unnamed protein product [Blepharisma stoltei]